MICPNCNTEYSAPVMPMHVRICKPKEEIMQTEQTEETPKLDNKKGKK